MGLLGMKRVIEVSQTHSLSTAVVLPRDLSSQYIFVSSDYENSSEN